MEEEMMPAAPDFSTPSLFSAASDYRVRDGGGATPPSGSATPPSATPPSATRSGRQTLVLRSDQGDSPNGGHETVSNSSNGSDFANISTSE